MHFGASGQRRENQSALRGFKVWGKTFVSVKPGREEGNQVIHQTKNWQKKRGAIWENMYGWVLN